MQQIANGNRGMRANIEVRGRRTRVTIELLDVDRQARERLSRTIATFARALELRFTTDRS